MELQKILKIKYPIIQGGMANIATGEFAATVANAGALGLIGSGGMKPEELRENIAICKKMTDRPFGVNLMLLNPYVDEMAKILEEEKVPVVTTGAGNPAKYIESWKNNGMSVFPVVSSPALAVRMERYGVDGVICEGTEAGGHIGEMTTMTLVVQVAKRVSVPVIAAGGIASGKQMLASEILGATGIQLGTLFLATEECPIHSKYKEKVIQAKDNQVTVIGRKNGKPTRLLKNNMTNEYLKLEKMESNAMELEKFTIGALRRAVREGDIKNGSLMCGQVVGQIHKIKTVEQMLKDLYNEYLKERTDVCRSWE